MKLDKTDREKADLFRRLETVDQHTGCLLTRMFNKYSLLEWHEKDIATAILDLLVDEEEKIRRSKNSKEVQTGSEPPTFAKDDEEEKIRRSKNSKEVTFAKDDEEEKIWRSKKSKEVQTGSEPPTFAKDQAESVDPPTLAKDQTKLVEPPTTLAKDQTESVDPPEPPTLDPPETPTLAKDQTESVDPPTLAKDQTKLAERPTLAKDQTGSVDPPALAGDQTKSAGRVSLANGQTDLTKLTGHAVHLNRIHEDMGLEDIVPSISFLPIEYFCIAVAFSPFYLFVGVILLAWCIHLGIQWVASATVRGTVSGLKACFKLTLWILLIAACLGLFVGTVKPVLDVLVLCLKPVLDLLVLCLDELGSSIGILAKTAGELSTEFVRSSSEFARSSSELPQHLVVVMQAKLTNFFFQLTDTGGNFVECGYEKLDSFRAEGTVAVGRFLEAVHGFALVLFWFVVQAYFILHAAFWKCYNFGYKWRLV